MSDTSWGERQAGDSPVGSATLAGLRTQLRVIHALILREMRTRFGRRPLGFLWLFIEPLLFAGVMAGIREFTGFGYSVPGVPIFVFALVSYLPFFTFRAIVARAPQVQGSLQLLYHSPIKLIDLMLARHALEAAAVISVMALLVFGVGLWAEVLPNSIPALVAGLVLLFLFSHGMGLAAGAVGARFAIASRLISPMLFILLPLSGAVIAMHHLDPVVRDVLMWNPLVHVHEMVREGFFGDRLPSYFDIGYLAFWVAVVNLLGLAALRAVRPALTL